MQVRDCMTREVRLIDPDETIEEAAVLMATIDAGVLPVALDDRLVGMVTDRDIAIRGVGMSLQPNAKVRAVMSSEVLYCFEDDDIGDVLANMADMQIRRLPVVDRDKRLVGILSLSDVAGNGDMARAGKVLCEIARPSALHSQAV
ncbi:MAG: inosine-5-monophosphate dehydrogenase [Sphingomonas sp. 66-10]|nr:MAG: inosine-5-monophosphate dehydrogenase [Sphingomonas sp. 66-10]